MMDVQFFKPGIVKINCLITHISKTKKISEQLNDLDEDMLFVEYPHNFSLDVGYYVDVFTVLIIKGTNWDKPIKSKSCKNLEELELIIKEFHNYIVNNLLNK